MQCVAVCYSVLQCVTVFCRIAHMLREVGSCAQIGCDSKFLQHAWREVDDLVLVDGAT